MTIKQQIHNWIYGENSREQNRYHHYSEKATVERFVILAQVQPDGSKVFGIDVSHWNLPGTVNFQQLKDQYNLQFVILKGCDGSVNSNYYFENLQAVKDAGLLWGMYCWLYPASKVNIDAQVNAWHARAIIDPPPLGIFIDCEWTYYGGVPANPGASDLRSAHDKLKAKQGKNAITYTAKGYADAYLKGFDFSREELWVANYNVPAPAMPNGATTYTYWQFTSTFMFNGKNYDGNYFNGTQAEFNERYGATPPTGETPMLYGKVNTAVLNIRNAGSASGIDIGDLQQNDYIVAYRSVGGWWELKEAYRGSWTGAPVLLANGTPVNNSVSPMWAKDSYIVVVPAPVVPPSAPTKPVSVTVTLDGYKPLTLSGEMEQA